MDGIHQKKCLLKQAIVLLLLLFSCNKDEVVDKQNNNSNTLNYKPTVYIQGPNQGKKGFEYEFKILSYRIGYSYIFDWGDGIIRTEASYGDYGGPTTVRHTWTSTGTFQVRIKEKNNATYQESEWTEPVFIMNICDDCYTLVYNYTSTYGLDIYQLPSGQIPYGGNLILANFYNNNTSDILLIKTNMVGDITWTKSIGQPNKNDDIRSSLITNNEIIILCSNSIYKVDYMGEINYYVELEGLNAEKIIQTQDGNYLICGSLLNSDGEELAFISKRNSYFHDIWIKPLNLGKAFSIVENDDGTIWVWLSNLRIIKLDQNGNVILQKDYSEGQQTIGKGYILKLNDGNLLASCLISSNNGINNTAYVLKISPYGELVFKKSMTSINYSVFNIKPTNDNCFIAFGRAVNINTATTYITYQKMNSNAEILWSKTYDTDCSIISGAIYGAAVTPENKFLFTGYVRNKIPYSLDYANYLFLMKTNEQGIAPIP